MKPEDEKNTLQHLLYLEAEAAALVERATAEADRRLSEGEKLCRASYDEAYSTEMTNLEAVYIKEIAAIREDYKKLLEAYRISLASCPVDRAAFSALAERFFFGV